MNLQTAIPPFSLQNPVILASGTAGYGIELDGQIELRRLGALVCKGTTLAPRLGNPQPRLAETPAGLLNSIGLENIGIDRLISEKAPVWATWSLPVVVNLAGGTVAEYVEMADRLNGVAGVSGIELNLSCPNVDGGLEFGTNPQLAAQVVATVRRITAIPLWVKLSPNVTDIVEIARAVAEAGADALTLVNTLKGMAVDIKTRRPVLSTIGGGLSGPAIKPVALYMVYQVAGAVGVPVIGCGGIATADDALEFLMAGARAVQVGTATMINPQAPLDILRGIEDFMAREGFTDLRQLIGLARVKE